MKPGTSFDNLNADLSDISDSESPVKKKLKPVDTVEPVDKDAPPSPILKKKKKLAASSSTSNFGDRTTQERKKRGKGIEWISFESFETFQEYEASDIGKEIKNDFIQHKKYKSDTVYWCRYAKKKDFKCEKKYKLVKNLNGSVDVLQPEENIHDHIKVSNTRKTNDYASCDNSIKKMLSLDVKTRIIRKELKENSLLEENISKKTFQQKLYREKKKLSQAAVKINYETLEEIIEVNSAAPNDKNEPYIVRSSVSSANELRFIMIIR